MPSAEIDLNEITNRKLELSDNLSAFNCDLEDELECNDFIHEEDEVCYVRCKKRCFRNKSRSLLSCSYYGKRSRSEILRIAHTISSYKSKGSARKMFQDKSKDRKKTSHWGLSK